MKSCGKTTVGSFLSKTLGAQFVELDHEIERINEKQTGKRLSCREIFIQNSKDIFRFLETKALQSVVKRHNMVLACGGGTPLTTENQKLLEKQGTIIFLNVDETVLLSRIIKGGIPAFFPKNTNPKTALHDILNIRKPIYKKTATMCLTLCRETPEEIVSMIKERIRI